MHRTGTKHIVRHMQKSVVQWSVISKFTCMYNSVQSERYIPLIRNPIGTACLIPRVCAPRVTRCRLGKYWWRDFFRKRLAGCWLESRHAQLPSFAAISVWPRACEAISSRPRICLSALFFIQNIDLSRVLSEWSWYGFLYLNEYVFLWSHCFVGAFSVAAHFLLSYNKNNVMSVILRSSAFRISKFYCRNPSGSQITAGWSWSWGIFITMTAVDSGEPILGVHMLSMTHREAAIFDDACTVPTPCLLLPGSVKNFAR